MNRTEGVGCLQLVSVWVMDFGVWGKWVDVISAIIASKASLLLINDQYSVFLYQSNSQMKFRFLLFSFDTMILE